jgi:hypothetical protein
VRAAAAAALGRLGAEQDSSWAVGLDRAPMGRGRTLSVVAGRALALEDIRTESGDDDPEVVTCGMFALVNIVGENDPAGSATSVGERSRVFSWWASTARPSALFTESREKLAASIRRLPGFFRRTSAFAPAAWRTRLIPRAGLGA